MHNACMVPQTSSRLNKCHIVSSLLARVMADSDGVIMNGFTAEQEAALASKAEKFEFQAEVNRLMDIIINSLCK